MITKTPLLVPDKWNSVSGKELVNMGKRLDSNGVLINTEKDYKVWIFTAHAGGWKILPSNL
jgi:hypothetical protein